MKAHIFRELVNDLRDIATQWHGSQQLRERISRRLRQDVSINERQPLEVRRDGAQGQVCFVVRAVRVHNNPAGFHDRNHAQQLPRRPMD